MCILSYYHHHHQIGYINHQSSCRVRSWNNGIGVCFTMLVWASYWPVEENWSIQLRKKRSKHGYSISQKICTRFCCALFCCGHVIVHNEFTRSIIHIHQGCFAGAGAIVRLPQCRWSKPDGYGKISQCITTTKHSKAKTVCIFLGLYCTIWNSVSYTQVKIIFVMILCYSCWS